LDNKGQFDLSQGFALNARGEGRMVIGRRVFTGGRDGLRLVWLPYLVRSGKGLAAIAESGIIRIQDWTHDVEKAEDPGENRVLVAFCYPPVVGSGKSRAASGLTVHN
ncbi:MAG: hypothetical protein RMI39_09015, partial [Thermoanaerobaculum sp.]|nr:hypothetical protein [Thermoanaerobaculum sp.]